MAENRPFKIDGVAIPTPTSYDFNIEDLSSDATGRTLDGVMHKDVVSVKDYYNCTWSQLSWDDAAILMNAINGKTQVAFTHADPRVPGKFITGQYYVGQRGGAALDLSSSKTSRRNWRNIKFQFIQI